MNAVRLRGGLIACALLGWIAGSLAAAVPIPKAAPAIQGNRAPYAVAFPPDGKRAYVTEQAEGTVAVLDAERLTVTGRFQTGGERPTGLAVTPDGKELLVANSYSGTVAVLDARTGARRALVPLPGVPSGVAVAPDGARAYVTVSQLDQVAVLDRATARVTVRIPVGRRPRALALTPDGKLLAVANLAGGSVSVIDTATLKERERLPLRGVNVRGIAVARTQEIGTEAYVTVMPPFNRKATTDPQEIWHNVVQGVPLGADGGRRGEEQWLDFARIPGTSDVIGSPDGHDIVLDRTARHAWIAVAGRDVVTRITIRDPRRDAIWPISQIETPVGANPRGLALSPDGRRLWVTNHLGNSVSVLDTARPSLVRTIDLGPASRKDPSIPGQYLFNNAGLTRQHRFTCASCHPDGASDGLAWSFVHVRDGVPRRNSRDLRAGIHETAPFRWSGLDAHLKDFLREEVTGLLFGPEPGEAEVKALEEAVRSFRLPPNPYRAPDGTLTAAARAGQALFEAEAGCGGCHGGPKRGGTGKQAAIGTSPPGVNLDVPHLTGVYDSAPYLHDGRAATLEEIFEKHDSGGRHGNFRKLTPAQRAQLIRFLREL